jgi:hypothetical protein
MEGGTGREKTGGLAMVEASEAKVQRPGPMWMVQAGSRLV